MSTSSNKVLKANHLQRSFIGSSSERLKRKAENTNNNRLKKTAYEEDVENDENQYYLVSYVDEDYDDAYSVLANLQITFDQQNSKLGKVRERGIFYDVKILKSGSKEYINKKAESYRQKKSIETTSDENMVKKVKPHPVHATSIIFMF